MQVVKIADTTLKKRLDEFKVSHSPPISRLELIVVAKATPSGALTLADFRNVWLEDEMDPPAYTKGREREEREREAAENGEEEEESGVDEDGEYASHCIYPLPSHRTYR